MILAVSSLKGGAGKTTTAVALTMAMRARGLRTLLVDLDPQASATLWMGQQKRAAIAKWFERKGQARLQPLVVEGDLIPSSSHLKEAARSMVGRQGWEFILKRGLRQVSEGYDHVIVDCPPGDNPLSFNALVASDRVIIPIQPKSHDGLVSLLQLTDDWQALTGATAARLGAVVLCMAQEHTRATQGTIEWLKRKYAREYLEPAVPYTVAVRDAWGARTPLAGRIGGKATEAYGEIAEKILQRVRRWKNEQGKT